MITDLSWQNTLKGAVQFANVICDNIVNEGGSKIVIEYINSGWTIDDRKEGIRIENIHKISSLLMFIII